MLLRLLRRSPRRTRRGGSPARRRTRRSGSPAGSTISGRRTRCRRPLDRRLLLFLRHLILQLRRVEREDVPRELVFPLVLIELARKAAALYGGFGLARGVAEELRGHVERGIDGELLQRKKLLGDVDGCLAHNAHAGRRTRRCSAPALAGAASRPRLLLGRAPLPPLLRLCLTLRRDRELLGSICGVIYHSLLVVAAQLPLVCERAVPKDVLRCLPRPLLLPRATSSLGCVATRLHDVLVREELLASLEPSLRGGFQVRFRPRLRMHEPLLQVVGHLGVAELHEEVIRRHPQEHDVRRLHLLDLLVRNGVELLGVPAGGLGRALPRALPLVALLRKACAAHQRRLPELR
mmetsp:Transcript_33837/g.106894  ORF Transcript_33837/g.106894 Transcript_33837/m.106894 type:complete len:349 (-) Transcript_33837:630-1676(-)